MGKQGGGSAFFKAKQAAVVFLVLAGISCAPLQTNSLSTVATQCAVSNAQAKAFHGFWPTKPVPLAIQANDFSASEITAIQAAIHTWNIFFEASKGYSFYLNGSSELAISQSNLPRVNAATACNQSMITSNGFLSPIMIYKNQSAWNYGSSVIALTSLCPAATSNSQLNMLVAGVMEINFSDYFNSGQPIPDLQSIVLHELGHLMGLGHSCDGAGCTAAPAADLDAVMYPSIGFNGVNGVAKTALQVSDEERANCLY